MGEGTTTSAGGAAVVVDDTAFPVVVITFSGAPVSVSDWESMLSAIERLLARERPIGLLVDARRGLGAGATHRRLAADFMRRSEAALRRHCRGVVTVSSSALVRGVITAIQWVVTPPFPDRVEAQIEPARRWIEQQLAEER